MCSECKDNLRRWSDDAAGLPERPASGGDTCWSNIRFRHVTKIAVAVVNILITVTMFVDIKGILLVIMFILFILATVLQIISLNPQYIFMPHNSDKMLVGAGFVLESVFIYSLSSREDDQHTPASHNILMILTLFSAVVSWSTCLMSSRIHLMMLGLILTTLLQSSWMLHIGINNYYKVDLNTMNTC